MIHSEETQSPQRAIFMEQKAMKEHIVMINHLAEVLYNESRDLDTVSKGKAELYQDIIDDIQEHIDSILNELTQPQI